MLVLDANILMRAVLGKHARELLAKYGRLGDTTNGQRIPRGKPWDRVEKPHPIMPGPPLQVGRLLRDSRAF